MNPLLFQGVFISSAKAEKYNFLNKMTDLLNKGEVYQYIYSWVLFIKIEYDNSFIILSGAFSGDFISKFQKLKWKLREDHTYSSELVEYFIEDGEIKVKLNDKTTSTIWFDKYKKTLQEVYIDPVTKKKVRNEFMYFPWVEEGNN